MPSRPEWYDPYWKKLDKETVKKLRTMCPRCGSSNTYYNNHYKTWRCARCEHSFVIKGYGGSVPWWRRIFPFLNR